MDLSLEIFNLPSDSMKKPDKYQEIKARVEELVFHQFPSALFEALLEQHKRHGFRTNCKCAYCEAKRYYISLPGWSKWTRNDGFIYENYKKRMKEFEKDDII